MRVSAVTICLSLVALAVGCGGGEKEPLSRGVFEKQANQICQEGMNKQVAAVAAGYKKRREEGKPADTKAASEELLLDNGLPPMQQMADELSELDAPSALEDQVSEMVAAFEKGNRRIAAEPAKVLAGTDVYEDARDRAGALRLEACGEIY